MLLTNKKWLFAATASLVLAACGSSQKDMYHWGNGVYANSVYKSLTQEGDPQEQIKNLEAIAQKGPKVAPGLYAQLGLLYNQIGNGAKASECFNKEAELFPESRTYMQFLLNKGKVAQPENKAEETTKAKKGAKQ